MGPGGSLKSPDLLFWTMYRLMSCKMIYNQQAQMLARIFEIELLTVYHVVSSKKQSYKYLPQKVSDLFMMYCTMRISKPEFYL